MTASTNTDSALRMVLPPNHVDDECPGELALRLVEHAVIRVHVLREVVVPSGQPLDVARPLEVRPQM